MRLSTISAALLALATAMTATAPASAVQSAEAGAWEIGPIIRGRNHSVGMPLSPAPARGGWSFDFPYPSVSAGHVHYVTFNHGPMIGKSRIVMRYRIDAEPGVRFVSRERPDSPAILSLYFQRRGDNWSGRGRFDTYRWYAPVNTAVPLTPGEHEVSVSLRDNWTAVNVGSAAADPFGFQEALADADRVGFVLGSVWGRGHGVYATGPARFTLISFRVI